MTIRYLLLLLLACAAPSWALTFGTGCANPCGVEEIVAGGTATCSILVGHDAADGFDPLIVESAQYVVSHADGPELVAVEGLPVSLAAGEQRAFPVTIATDAGDLAGGILSLRAAALLVPVFDGVEGTAVRESFPDFMHVVPASTCDIPTTLAPTTTSTTTTTVQTILGFPRMKVCQHNGQPKKCQP